MRTGVGPGKRPAVQLSQARAASIALDGAASARECVMLIYLFGLSCAYALGAFTRLALDTRRRRKRRFRHIPHARRHAGSMILCAPANAAPAAPAPSPRSSSALLEPARREDLD